MALDKRYLKWHGNQWLVVMKVPEKVRPMIGKAHLKAPLRTHSLAEANELRWPHVMAFRKLLSEAERSAAEKPSRASVKGPIVDPVMEEARAWLEHPGDTEAYDLYDLAEERARQIEKQTGNAGKAEAFFKLVTKQGTPTTTFVEQWLAETPMKPKQVLSYRKAVLTFSEHTGCQLLDDVDRKVAGGYVSARVAKGDHWKTINREVSSIRSYWKWLIKKGHAREDVWSGQSLPKPKTSKKEEPRPFTVEEIGKLLNGDCKPFLKEAMRIALYTGMRVDEIARLKVENLTDDGFIEIEEAKTKAGERLVPIHNLIKGIIERRTKAAGQEGCSPEGWLFHDLPEVAEGSAVQRSNTISKAFTTYRRRLGVDDVVPGSRQARTTFHSFRRSFITLAEQAGQLMPVIETVVGHARQGMSAGRYSAGPSKDQLRACVEAMATELMEQCEEAEVRL